MKKRLVLSAALFFGGSMLLPGTSNAQEMYIIPPEAGSSQTVAGFGAALSSPVELFIDGISTAQVEAFSDGGFAFNDLVLTEGQSLVVQNQVSWYFNTTGDAEGWDVSAGNSTVDVDGGTLTLTAGAAPNRLDMVMGLPTDTFKVLEFRLRNPGTANQIDIILNDTVVVPTLSFPVQAENNDFVTYQVPFVSTVAGKGVPPGGTNWWLYFDIIGATAADELEFDYIRVREYVDYHFDNDGDLMNNGVVNGNATVAGGALTLTNTTAATNAYLETIFWDYDTSIFNTLETAIDANPTIAPDNLVSFNYFGEGPEYSAGGHQVAWTVDPGTSVVVTKDLTDAPLFGGTWSDEASLNYPGGWFSPIYPDTAGEEAIIDYIRIRPAVYNGPSVPVTVLAAPTPTPTPTPEPTPTPAPGVTVTVGAGADYETLGEALVALTGSKSGPTTIDIVSNTTETVHVEFNSPDPIIVNGNDNVLVFTAGTIAGGVASSIVNSDNSSVTINDVTLIPEYDTAGGETNFGAAAMRIWDQGTATTESVVLMTNVTITGSTVGGVPVDPTAAAPADITRFVFGSSPIFAGGIRIDATTGGNDNTVDIVDSIVSHTASRAIYAAFKDGMKLTTERVQTSYNSGVGLRTFAMTGDWDVIDCISTFNSDHGFALASLTGGSTDAIVNIIGGSFSNNLGAGYGIDLASAATVTIDNVEIIGNANRGLRYSNSNGLVGASLTNTIIADNGSFGIDINEIDLANSFQAPNSFDNLIIANNGSISATPSNISNGATFSAAPGSEPTITISNVTFHNPGGDQGDAFIARNFDHRFGSDQIWEFVDCIFSGNAADDDVAFVVRGATDRNIAINVSNSAIVLEGPHALDAIEEDQGNPVVITETDVINADPIYLSTTAGDADFLDVDSQNYGAAGTGGAPLSGGANYAGGTSVSEWMLLND